jgi:hypothetical protein
LSGMSHWASGILWQFLIDRCICLLGQPWKFTTDLSWTKTTEISCPHISGGQDLSQAVSRAWSIYRFYGRILPHLVPSPAGSTVGVFWFSVSGCHCREEGSSGDSMPSWWGVKRHPGQRWFDGQYIGSERWPCQCCFSLGQSASGPFWKEASQEPGVAAP